MDIALNMKRHQNFKWGMKYKLISISEEWRVIGEEENQKY